MESPHRNTSISHHIVASLMLTASAILPPGNVWSVHTSIRMANFVRHGHPSHFHIEVIGCGLPAFTTIHWHLSWFISILNIYLFPLTISILYFKIRPQTVLGGYLRWGQFLVWHEGAMRRRSLHAVQTNGHACMADADFSKWMKIALSFGFVSGSD